MARRESFCDGRGLLLCDATVLIGAVVANRAAPRTGDGVLHTSDRLTAIHACRAMALAFDGVLAGPVAFGNDPHFAAELLG